MAVARVGGVVGGQRAAGLVAVVGDHHVPCHAPTPHMSRYLSPPPRPPRYCTHEAPQPPAAGHAAACRRSEATNDRAAQSAGQPIRGRHGALRYGAGPVYL